MKDTYYFSHDSNARNDEKILMLRAEHGWEGYGIYWALIEMMFESTDTALYHDKIKGIAFSCNIDITLLQSVINTCIREGLFVSDDDMFWSESFLPRDKYRQKKRFIRLYETDVKLWYQIRNIVFKRDNYTCQYCGKRGGKLEVDHIIPISKGGTNDIENLATSCRKCNRQKYNKSAQEFIEWREGNE